MTQIPFHFCEGFLMASSPIWRGLLSMSDVAEAVMLMSSGVLGLSL